MRAVVAGLLMPLLGPVSTGWAQAPNGWTVVRPAVPVAALMDDEGEPVYLAVVVVTPQDDGLSKVRRTLEGAVVTQFGRHAKVAEVAAAPMSFASATTDPQVVAAVAQELDVDRVLVVRIVSEEAPDAGPAVHLSLYAESGQYLATTVSHSVVIARPPPRSSRALDAPSRAPPPQRRLPPKAAESPWDGWGDDEPAEEMAPDESEFKRRALVVKRRRLGKGKGKGKSPRYEYVLTRNGRPLSDQELNDLGAPLPDEPLDETKDQPNMVLRVGGVSLLPMGLVTVPGGAVMCLLGCVGACGACGGLLDTSADPFQSSLIYAFGGGIYCGWFAAAVGAVAGLLVGVMAAALGAGMVAWTLRGGSATARHPYVAFATDYNRRLARKLGLRTRDLERRYFPAAAP